MTGSRNADPAMLLVHAQALDEPGSLSDFRKLTCDHSTSLLGLGEGPGICLCAVL